MWDPIVAMCSVLTLDSFDLVLNVKAFITDIHPVQIFATTKVCEAFELSAGPSSAPKFSSCSPPGPAIEELSSVSPADVDIPVKSKLDSSSPNRSIDKTSFSYKSSPLVVPCMASSDSSSSCVSNSVVIPRRKMAS
ncbi:hypothetical protein M513_12404 [Trichuris suis]|uniref:Uncharacterized protein n=1 Tax=Trichuris suis TaxID=68888 RepID=A0A085LNZ8_9BILA|nr:hypothetical protein M513_12404 [Trichuris suis]